MNRGSCTGDELPSAVCSISAVVMSCASLPRRVVVAGASSCILTTKNGLTFSLVGRGLECV